MKYYLAIDIGASSGCHMLSWIEDGKMHLQGVRTGSTGGHLSGGTEDKTKTAEHLLTTIFSAEEAMVDSFHQISDQEDLDAWAQKYYGDDMTEDGLHAAMQGRILSQGIVRQEDGTTMETPKITIEKRENAGDSEWYDYTVIIQTSDGAQEFTGSLLLKETDGKWLVHDITGRK